MQSSLEVQKEITAVVQTSIYQTQAPKSLSTVHSPTPTAVQESSAYVSDLATQHTTYRYIQDDKHSTESDSALKLCKEQGTRASLSPSPSPSSQPVNRHQRWRLVLSPSTPALGSNSPRTPPCAQPFTPACNFERIYGDRSAPGTCCYCNQAITFQKSQSAEAVLQTLHDSWMASDKDSNGSGSSTVLSTQIHSLSDSTTLNSILDTFPRLETFTRSRSVASSLECLSSDEHGFRSLFRPVMKKKSSLFNLFRPKKNKVTIHDTKLEV
ncbi:uncharacterized protein BYT42DRAFT_556879 [Radiomyces spectabilis]|uniref:uncharacterized protein n=1 Tax=Radiomyces spectabilis TaxID=64574 RepID=UPI0022200E42|nr:uncharacterized protein BYT42DRAFT_556879 [Radiomyces spectabilis]KAI8391450.1 hypothetical protein BYT42DRAFT_556879 [Radiomyces spectabilis]